MKRGTSVQPPSNIGGSVENLTQSKRRAFLNCPRYYYHKHEQRLDTKIQKKGRRRGHAFGAALDALTGRENDLVVVESGLLGEQFRPPDRLDVIHETIEECYEGVFAADQSDQDEIEFEKYALPQIIVAYIDVYGLGARREIEYTLPLRNPNGGSKSRTWRLAGKLDGVERKDGQFYLIEDKLVSQISKTTVDHIPLDMQTQEYVDAMLQSGFPMPMIKFRHTRWPSIRRKNGETVDQFCNRFGQDLVDRMDWYFHQEIFFFPEGVLDDFREGRWATAKNIMAARKTGVWPQNTMRCLDFGKCEFMPLCLQQPDAESLYVVREEADPELTGGNNGKTT